MPNHYIRTIKGGGGYYWICSIEVPGRVITNVAYIFEASIFRNTEATNTIILKSSGNQECFSVELVNGHPNDAIRIDVRVVRHGLHMGEATVV